jgi:uncharacterized surface protein with fasciclin (FAS1) repeats
MTSASGYYAYQDLVQTYSVGDLRYIPNQPYRYHKDSVAGYLESTGDFTILLFLLRTAKMDVIVDQQQFRSTLFACPDSLLRMRFDDEFFMNLDRGSIMKLINVHILPRMVDEATLRSKKLSILQTKDDYSKLTFINNGETMPLLVNGADNGIECHIISPTIVRNNGVIYVIDDLLLPENF